MKEFFSKFTFGFLMAQFFPGAVALLCVSCPIVSIMNIDEITCLNDLYTQVFELWFDPISPIIIFVFLASGAGMLIHGVHWMVIAWLAKHKTSSEEVDDAKSISALESFWHNERLWIQLLVSPVNGRGGQVFTIHNS